MGAGVGSDESDGSVGMGAETGVGSAIVYVISVERGSRDLLRGMRRVDWCMLVMLRAGVRWTKLVQVDGRR
jgi:hypothetical protein